MTVTTAAQDDPDVPDYLTGGWKCADMQGSLAALDDEDDLARIANVSFRETKAPFTDAPLVELRVAVLNKTSSPLTVSVEGYLTKGDQQIALLSAAPAFFDAVSANESAVVRGAILSMEGVLDLADRACIRWDSWGWAETVSD